MKESDKTSRPESDDPAGANAKSRTKARAAGGKTPSKGGKAPAKPGKGAANGAAPGAKAAGRKPAKRRDATARASEVPGALPGDAGSSVPGLDPRHVAVAAYFKFERRLAYGHLPDPVADWFAAEAELIEGFGSN